MIRNLSRKILIVCLICAVAPPAAAVVYTVWFHPATSLSPAQTEQLTLLVGLTFGLAVVIASAAAFILYDDVRRALGGLRTGLGRFSSPAGQTAATAPPQDELSEMLDEANARLRELATLRETALDLTVQLEMPRLLQTIVERATRLLEVTAGVIYETDVPRRKLRLLAAVGLRPEPVGWEMDFGEGVAGRVAETGASLVIHDYERWPGRSRLFKDYPLFNVIGVPLRWQGQLIGVLNIEDEVGDRRFSPRDVELAEQFANQAAMAIGNARLYAAVNRQAERLALLHKGSQAISHSLDLEQVYQAIYDGVGQLMPHEAFSIALLDESGQEFEAVFLMDRGVRRPNVRAPAGAGLTGHMLNAKLPLLFRSRAEWPPGVLHFGEAESVESVLAVPLQVGERIIGALATQSYQRDAFHEEDTPLLVTLANQAAVAIQNARLFRSVQLQLTELSVVHEVAREAISTAELDQVITRAMQALRARLGYDHLSLLLLSPAGGRLRVHPSFVQMYPGEPYVEEIALERGITSHVVQTGQPRRVPDVDQEPRYLRVFPATRSEMCVPLKLGERVIGVLNAEANTLNAFDPEDERLLTIVAGFLTPLIENASLYERDRRRLNELTLLAEIALAAIAAQSFDEVLAQAIAVLQRRLGYDLVGVDLLDESGAWLTAHPSYYGVADSHAIVPVHVGTGIIGRALETGRPIRVDDVAAEPMYIPLDPAVRSELAVPLRVADRMIGVLNTESRRVAAYGETDEQLLTVVAGMLAPIIDNARLRARAEQHARELDLLFKAQLAASASLDLNAVLTAIAEHLARALDVTSAYMCELDAADNTIVVAEWYSPEVAQAERSSDLDVHYGPEMSHTALRALQIGRSVVTGPDDPEASEAERAHLREYGARTVLTVPLMRQAQSLGYVELWDSRRTRVFTDAELQLAQTLAGNAAVALEHAKLYQAAQRQAEHMRLINDIGRDIAGILDVAALTARVGQRLVDAFGYYQANVGLIQGDELVFRPRHDPHRSLMIPETRFPLDGAGIVAWVAKHGRPWVAADVKSDSHFIPSPYFPDARSEAAVPLIAHGQNIGVLDVQSTEPGRLGSEDVTILEAISSQLAVAIENARLFAEARHRADEVAALLATTLALSSSLDLSARLSVIAEQAQKLVGADSSTIYKLQPNGETMRPIMALDDQFAREVMASNVQVGQGITGHVAQTGVAELINRVDLDPRAIQIPGTPLTPESMIAVPLRVGDRVIGVMAVYHEGLKEFKPHDLELISSFAAQAAVAMENDELYQTLVERAKSLQAAYDEMAQMDRFKDEMVQNISHELRTPITFLKSYVDLLLSGELGRLQPEQEKSLRVVADKTESLARLVNDIITLQAVTPATIRLAPLDLVALARQAADGVAAAAQEAGVRLIVNLPPGPIPIRGDRLRLSQVFDNLLGNAVKFTGTGGEIGLIVQPGHNVARVEVRDTGIGIAPDSIQRIFDRFYQVDGTPTRRRGGIGLGLSISKLIVESHGGYIGVESTVGYGSCFYFMLPLDQQPQPPPAAP